MGNKTWRRVACGAASRLRLKRRKGWTDEEDTDCRMWSGFSSEIETKHALVACRWLHAVACGAASRLRLKPSPSASQYDQQRRRMWSGFSSEIETENNP